MTRAALIFDMDGVLVDSEAVANAVFSDHLAREGVDLPAADAKELFSGLSLPDCVTLVEERFGVSLPADFIEALQRETFARLRGELQPIPQVAEALSALGDRPRCLASSSAPDKIDLCLELTGLAPWFPPSRRLSATMVTRGKPAPDLFLLAANTLGVEPARCVVIEDSVYGVEAAAAAGMGAVGFGGSRSDGGAALEDLADVVITEMGQLPGAVLVLEEGR